MFSNLRSLIFKLDPEKAHTLAIKSLKFNLVPNLFKDEENDKLLKTKIFFAFITKLGLSLNSQTQFVISRASCPIRVAGSHSSERTPDERKFSRSAKIQTAVQSENSDQEEVQVKADKNAMDLLGLSDKAPQDATGCTSI